MEGYRFSTELVVRYNEVDAQGVVNNAVYLVWFELARIAYLGRFPGGYRGMVDGGVDATNVEAHVRYRAPCRWDDRLLVHARTTDVRGARFRFEYAIERVSDPPGIVADGWTVHACVDAQTLRPVRVPPWLLSALAAAEAM